MISHSFGHVQNFSLSFSSEICAILAAAVFAAALRVLKEDTDVELVA